MQLLRGRHNASLREVYARKAENSLDSIAIESLGSVVTIGNFDGVHRGHQAIIRRVCEEAKRKGLPSVVVVFEPQPMEFFRGSKAPARLMRFREKYEAFSSFDIDYVFCLKFDRSLSQLSAEAFVKEVLVDHLSVAHLVVGDDFRFGDDRSGDFELLRTLGNRFGFTVENTHTIAVLPLDESDTDGGNLDLGNAEDVERASSTLVRSLLSKGEFEQVHKVLGRPYAMSGRVVYGEQLGRNLGFPTANVALHRLSTPLNGVYAVSCRFEDGSVSGEVFGVANVGVKPTVGHFRPGLEIHLFDFSQNIYGKKVSVRFHAKLRDEMKFDGLDALKSQISKDANEAKAYFQLDMCSEDNCSDDKYRE